MSARWDCLQESLANAVKVVRPGLASKSALPILEHVCIRAHGDGKRGSTIDLTATNLGVSIRVTLGALITEPGDIAIPGKSFCDYIPLCEPVRLQFSANEKQIELDHTSGKARWHTMDPLEFPLIPTFEECAQSFEVDLWDFISCLELVTPYTSDDNKRPDLSAVHLRAERNGTGDCVRLFAADGYRLAETSTKREGEVDLSVRIKRDAAKQLLTALKRLDKKQYKYADCAIGIGDGYLVFKLPDCEIAVQTSESTWDPCEQLRHRTYNTIKVVLGDWYRAVKQVSLKVGKDDPPKSIILTCSGDYVDCHAIGWDQSIPCHNVHDRRYAPVRINAQYLRDALNHLQKHYDSVTLVTLEPHGSDKPISLYAGNDWILIMPVTPLYPQCKAKDCETTVIDPGTCCPTHQRTPLAGVTVTLPTVKALPAPVYDFNTSYFIREHRPDDNGKVAVFCYCASESELLEQWAALKEAYPDRQWERMGPGYKPYYPEYKRQPTPPPKRTGRRSLPRTPRAKPLLTSCPKCGAPINVHHRVISTQRGMCSCCYRQAQPKPWRGTCPHCGREFEGGTDGDRKILAEHGCLKCRLAKEGIDIAVT